MGRNALLAIIVVLLAAIAIGGYMWYQDQQQSSLEISVGEDGISVDAN